ncbi:hypothetical protein GCM10010912_66050 [Paenibacillus albidus]|uniref:Uncharacterized protein n=1 Tax=Paenibacillus albidus TaxID=2041023 RepID=A0A917D850_9BACL|nr:hypothetical protein GCM10010912_66050 [Paenibacillus albidus]
MDLMPFQFTFNKFVAAAVDAADGRQDLMFIHKLMLDLSKRGVKRFPHTASLGYISNLSLI